MWASGVTRRGVIGTLGVSTLLGTGCASLRGVDAANVNHVLVVGYNYKAEANGGDKRFAQVALSNAAILVAEAFVNIERLNKKRGRYSETRVSLVCNPIGPITDAEIANTLSSIEEFCKTDFTGSNVILYFIGHGFVGADGVELVDPDGTSRPLWGLLDQFAKPGKLPASRVAILDCCRVQGDELTADKVNRPGEEVAFIFSAPPEVPAGNDLTHEGTTFTRAFIKHINDQVELSTLFLQLRQDPDILAAQRRANKTAQDMAKKSGQKQAPAAAQAQPIVEPLLYTSLSRPVWLAGAPNVFGDGKTWPLFFPG